MFIALVASRAGLYQPLETVKKCREKWGCSILQNFSHLLLLITEMGLQAGGLPALKFCLDSVLGFGEDEMGNGISPVSSNSVDAAKKGFRLGVIFPSSMLHRFLEMQQFQNCSILSMLLEAHTPNSPPPFLVPEIVLPIISIYYFSHIYTTHPPRSSGLIHSSLLLFSQQPCEAEK